MRGFRRTLRGSAIGYEHFPEDLHAEAHVRRQIEEIVPTLDDDLLYGFVKLRYRGLQKNATQLSRCARW